MAVSREAVIWGYRFLLGREPESDAVIQEKLATTDIAQLIRDLVGSAEFEVSAHALLFKRGDGILSQTAATNIAAKPGLRERLEQVESGMPASRDAALSLPERKTVAFRDLPRTNFTTPEARRMNGRLRYTVQDEHRLKGLTLGYHGGRDAATVEDVEIDLMSIPSLWIDISGSGSRITIGENCTGAWTFRLWDDATVSIGKAVTSNGTDCLINPGGVFEVGDDAMFSNAFVHVGDNHAIIDLSDGAALNYSARPRITVAPHVWVGARATLLADTTIGAGSIVGTGAVVKGAFPGRAVIAGVPARVLREGVSWTRDYRGEGAAHIIALLDRL
jgi:acetyltransferase-like isoleucine patch superfamily enzyme